jgi:hypothetical protein
MSRDLGDIVDLGELEPPERERLERVHELLVTAGPPPSLPAALRDAPAEPPRARILALPSRSRKRVLATLVAAAVTTATFAAGYLVGDASNGAADASSLVSLEGLNGAAVGSLHVDETGADGNVSLVLTVKGLPRQSGDHDYYELFVWRDGKPGYPCVGFKMGENTTRVRFTVPYVLKPSTELVVTAIVPGKVRWPGRVVMRTA